MQYTVSVHFTGKYKANINNPMCAITAHTFHHYNKDPAQPLTALFVASPVQGSLEGSWEQEERLGIALPAPAAE